VDIYSSGCSPAETHFQIPIRKLSEMDKQIRLVWLWHFAYRKAYGCFMIIQKCEQQSKKAYNSGFSKPSLLSHSLKRSKTAVFRKITSNEDIMK